MANAGAGKDQRLVVTGGAGFIGSQLVRGLNERGYNNVLIVDDLDPTKVANLAAIDFADIMSVKQFSQAIARDSLDIKPACIFHQGACSDTMATDGDYVFSNNYEYSKTILQSCIRQSITFVYASSASVYGDGLKFSEVRENEKPLNLYALSKWMFDQYVRREVLGQINKTMPPVVGLRYFNVYGPGETHKGRMASVAWHFSQQYLSDGKVRLFQGTAGYADGEQRRDFVYVDDVVSVNIAGMNGALASGIYNVGTGRCESFNDVASATINAWRSRQGQPGLSIEQMVEQALIEYIEFPAALSGKYQSFTEADISQLRAAGYQDAFASVEQGVAAYVDVMAKDSTGGS